MPALRNECDGLPTRETTRIEDMTYSLMSIFDISMPLQYSKGQKAFMRLQEEIMKRSADHPVFVWTERFTS
jgi:hypothetical protein